jgi:hypothetical protein
MEVKLNSTVNTVVVPEERKELSSVTINRMVDLPEERIVRVFISELRNPINLWEGEEYDAIGDWTNADVIARVNEYFKA